MGSGVCGDGGLKGGNFVDFSCENWSVFVLIFFPGQIGEQAVLLPRLVFSSKIWKKAH
jgi:hypothetical protein